MIITPEHLIKKYFPEPVETTRKLYDRLDLDGYGYSYSAWVKDAEEYCLSKYFTEEDYKALEGEEQNYWISPRAFHTLLESSPSKIGDEIRACATEIANRVATDRAFARQLQDQIDHEAGLSKVVPKIPKSLKNKYNETGQDAFEYTIQSDGRLYLDIISGFNFKPGQKIGDVLFSLKMEVEENIPFHIIEVMIKLTNDDILSYRTVWSCKDEPQKYGAILINRIIRVNLFEDTRKLIDSFDYFFAPSDLIALEAELQKVIDMQVELIDKQVDTEGLGQKILKRHNLNGQAYALAIKEILPRILEYEKPDADIETAFIESVNRYWDHYILQPDPSRIIIDDIAQMVKARIPRVELAMISADMLLNSRLCSKYFNRNLTNKQRQALFKDAAPRLIYTLAEAGFDTSIPAGERIAHMSAFIAEQLDMMKEILVETRQWPK
ncbi:MAG: hypothetical protein ACM3PE_13235 [Deltaproteobacteria bacterium]